MLLPAASPALGLHRIHWQHACDGPSDAGSARLRLIPTWNYCSPHTMSGSINPLTETYAGDADHELTRRFCGFSTTRMRQGTCLSAVVQWEPTGWV